MVDLFARNILLCCFPIAQELSEFDQLLITSLTTVSDRCVRVLMGDVHSEWVMGGLNGPR